MLQKRYQYISLNGEIKWTEWFNFKGSIEPKQLGKLKNQYKEI